MGGLDWGKLHHSVLDRYVAGDKLLEELKRARAAGVELDDGVGEDENHGCD